MVVTGPPSFADARWGVVARGTAQYVRQMRAAGGNSAAGRALDAARLPSPSRLVPEHRSSPVHRAAAVLALSLPAALGAQQSAPTPGSMPGYSAAAAQRERTLEADAVARPASASARASSRALSREPHVAGTPAQARTRDYVIAQMKQYGLETETRAYDVYLPHPTAVHVWRVAPDTLALDLREGPVAGDTTSATTTEVPPINGYGAAGDVSGEVVYVNYGLIEDYATLDSLGISVKGKIAVARYARSFRGIKAREAEKHGAAALLIYSDPQDDGYFKGDVYPEGPMRPPQGIQRGSVYNADGDPSTPGYASVKGAKRLPDAQLDVPHIPVVPIGYRNASELLAGVRGGRMPQTWQGGLPFRYHVGAGPVRARVQVTTDAATAEYKTIWDTFGVLRGTDYPDELVIIGGHRDAWGPGAADNVSGTTSILEAARALAELAKSGQRPKRTIVFATWDAEEWGLLGSTEYVEDDSLRLLRGAAAYFNMDVSAQGPNFGGGGSPSLRAMLRDVTAHVPDPSGKGSVYDVWRKSSGVSDTTTPAMGDPGGGSDFAGFYNHFGIPIAEWGFGGPGGVYHSAYDSFHWMETFGDPTFAYHAAAGRIAAAMALRTANAEVLPYDYVEYARTMRRYIAPMDRGLAAAGMKDSVSTAPLVEAIDRFERAAQTLERARATALAQPTTAARRARYTTVNARLRDVERAMTRPSGLASRPWFRNLVYAADVDNGYSNMPFPAVNEAVRARNLTQARDELRELAAHFGQATNALEAATRGLCDPATAACGAASAASAAR